VPVRSALENALTNAFSVAAALAPTGARMRDWQPPNRPADNPAGITIRYVDGFELWQPAFTVAADRLVLASRPAAIETHFTNLAQKAAGNSGGPGAVSEIAGTWAESSPDQVLVLNLAGWRRLIAERQRDLAEHAAETSALSVDEAERRIDRVLELSELLDAVFVTIATEPDALRIVIGGTAHAE
jgi:hypothetical protein